MLLNQLKVLSTLLIFLISVLGQTVSYAKIFCPTTHSSGMASTAIMDHINHAISPDVEVDERWLNCCQFDENCTMSNCIAIGLPSDPRLSPWRESSFHAITHSIPSIKTVSFSLYRPPILR